MTTAKGITKQLNPKTSASRKTALKNIMKEKKTTPGGHRQGSGRKPKPDKKINYNTKLRPDQVEWLRAKNNAAKVLEYLIDNAIKNN